MRFFLFLFLSLALQWSFADSPLTSTGFGEAYKNVPIVKKAYESNGELTEEFCAYIFNKKEDFGSRLALVNALSWNFDGKKNFHIALDYLKKNKKVKESNYQKKLSGEDLTCLAYIKAMDNYFNVEEALKIAEIALKKNKSSYTTQIIHALIKAQAIFDKDWCEVWKVCDKVRISYSLNQDLKEEAQNIIFKYMDLYKSYCK